MQVVEAKHRGCYKELSPYVQTWVVIELLNISPEDTEPYGDPLPSMHPHHKNILM